MNPRIGQVAILCRPHQLLEAAIAVSCLPADPIPLLMVVDPPPMSAAGFREAYAKYTVARQRSMGNVIGFEYRDALRTLGETEVLEAMREHNETHAYLTEPRSWLLRNGRYRRIMTDAQCRMAVLLFPPGPDDLKTFFAFGDIADEEQEKKVREWEAEDLIPASAKRHLLLPASARQQPLEGYDLHSYQHPGDLTELFWSLLHGADPLPQESISLDAPGDPVAVLNQLAEALERGVPLRLAGSSPGIQHQPAAPLRRPEAEEAVLVEAGDAESIVGVLYAAQRHAALTVIPPPPTAEITRALEEFDANQAGTAESRDHLLLEIERAVSAVLPQQLADSIGARPLTAFTAGIPYHFVRSAAADWRKKPIGHVVTDKGLMVYSEVALESAEVNTASFAAVFDPGFFEGHSETAAVRAAMDHHSAYPLVFSNESASLDALMRVSHSLPLDLLFFLSHGSRDAILLGDGALLRHHVVQWLDLPSAPILFNNSCLSWIGVGREFVRVGARGYIGTLWSVNSRDAADLATQSITRIIAGEPVAQAIKSTAIPPETELAYLYVGTANSRLRRPGTFSRDAREFVLQAAAALLQLLDKRYQADDVRQNKPLDLYLYARLAELLDRPDSKEADPDRLFPLLIQRLYVVSGACRHFDLTLEQGESFAAECLDLLDHLKLEEPEKNGRRGDVLMMRSRIREEFDDKASAEEDLRQVQELQAEGDAAKVHVLTSRVNNLMRAGAWSEAREIAEEAKQLAEKQGDRRTTMGIAGQLAQLMKRLGDRKAGLAYAIEGFRLAVELNDWHEQTVFKLDEAQLLMLDRQLPQALEAATEAGRIARAHQLPKSDLKAYGVQVRCNIELGNLEQAAKDAKRGLRQAVDMQDQFEQGSFLSDLGSIEARLGNHAFATQRFRQAAAQMTEAGAQDLAAALLLSGLQHAVQAEDWKQIGEVGGEQLISQFSVPWEQRVRSIGTFLGLLRDAARDIPGAQRTEALARLFAVCTKLLEFDKDARDIHIAQMSIVILHYWLEGSPEAARLAAELDGIVRGDVSWTDFVKQRPRG